MKKILISILSLIVVGCLLLSGACTCNGCSSDRPDVDVREKEVLQLSTGVKTLVIGETFSLKVFGTNGIAPVFSSENESVVTVNDSGVVTAIGVGNAAVTVTVGSQRKNCYVTVNEDNRIPVLRINNVVKENGVNLVPIGVGETYPLSVSVLFGGAIVDGQVTYSSDNPDIAAIDENGVITAGNVKGTAIIELVARYKGGFQEELCAEIYVAVSDVFWSFSFDNSDELYAVDSFNGKQYKTSARFSAKLRVGDKEYDNDQLTVTPGEGGYVEVSGDLIKAKKAGQTYIKLSFNDGTETYENLQNIKIERIFDDRTDSDSITFERKNSPSLRMFDSIGGGETQKVLDVTEKPNIEITVSQDNYEGLELGERQVEIYNEGFKVKVNLHVVDYLITDASNFKSVLYKATDEYIELGADIYGVGTYSRPVNMHASLFNGTINGNGHIVSDIVFPENTALFVSCGCTIKNIAFINVTLNKLSAVLTLNSLGSGLVTDNVYIRVNSCYPDETKPCGGLLVQIGNSRPVINNTIVEMNGLSYEEQGETKYLNAGPVAGAWWGSSIQISNSYFITDGLPYGTQISSADCSLGTNENEKYLNGESDYVFASGSDFASARAENVVNLSEFNTEFWDLDLEVPRFKNDNYNQYDDAIITTAKCVDGSDFVVSKNFVFSDGREFVYADTNTDGGNYVMYISDVGTPIKKIFANGMFVNGFSFDTQTHKLSLPSRGIAQMNTDSLELVFVTADKVYKSTSKVIDFAVATGEEFTYAMSNSVGTYNTIILTDDIDGAETFNEYAPEWFPIMSPTLDGQGHIINDLTVKGYGLFGGFYVGTIKNVAIKVSSVSLDAYEHSSLFAVQMGRANISNVYIEGDCKQVVYVSYGDNVLENVIVNVQGKNFIENSNILDGFAEDELNDSIVVDGNFFTTYGGGLPVSWAGTGFEVKNDGLYFGNKLIYTRIELTNVLPDGVLGYLEIQGEEDTQQITLPENVDYVKNFIVKGQLYNVSNYDKTTRTLTFDRETVRSAWYKGELDCSFEGSAGIYSAKIYVSDYVLRTADDITNKLSKTRYIDTTSWAYYSFVFANDIEGGTITYVADSNNRYNGVIDGKGHVLKNVTIGSHGLINYAFIGTLKNIAIVDPIGPESSDGILGAWIGNGGTLENVYVSCSTITKANLFQRVGGEANFKNVIYKVSTPSGDNGALYDADSVYTSFTSWQAAGNISDYVSENNVIAVDGSFFTTYKEGLPKSWKGTGFKVKADGLYINNHLIFAK